MELRLLENKHTQIKVGIKQFVFCETIILAYIAFHQREYEAVGGEIFLLLLPFVYIVMKEMFKELAEEIKIDF